ncbi:hypothetical protein [Deinococcus cellulosilyticus]|uniref:Uncharacterized protein n=1 Tax=Deinococcus cellulosilyticus (strain DSM 18568 / NBRC 106333 / KACC 11606 / 5516J-15) TaxID=1223518 RepID=A0A511N440_DEIC1|nr:hypothetical protein [Deinococcus cellulosilyticus]GEM47186.1 hypothetical protein DC3_28210 [Deinococcus cellulosilyticus NBRC 106333 = KACC 11606]
MTETKLLPYVIFGIAITQVTIQETKKLGWVLVCKTKPRQHNTEDMVFDGSALITMLRAKFEAGLKLSVKTVWSQDRIMIPCTLKGNTTISEDALTQWNILIREDDFNKTGVDPMELRDLSTICHLECTLKQAPLEMKETEEVKPAVPVKRPWKSAVPVAEVDTKLQLEMDRFMDEGCPNDPEGFWERQLDAFFESLEQAYPTGEGGESA